MSVVHSKIDGKLLAGKKSARYSLSLRRNKISTRVVRMILGCSRTLKITRGNNISFSSKVDGCQMT